MFAANGEQQQSQQQQHCWAQYKNPPMADGAQQSHETMDDGGCGGAEKRGHRTADGKRPILGACNALSTK